VTRGPVRIAVIGVGYMGARHAAKASVLEALGCDLRLVGVADVDSKRANRVAREFGTRGVSDGRELFEHADAVVVSVPTQSHFEVARAALGAGLDVLIEKPLASTVSEGEKLLELAREGGRIMQVGHIEWFNAAMPAIRENVNSPRFVEAYRLAPFTQRAAGIDVVKDLMIHDIDILQQLLGEEPNRIEAIGVSVVSDKVDIANARLGFHCGCFASLTASRITPTPTRRLRVYQPDGYISIDFLDSTASFSRRSGASGAVGSGVEVEELKVDPEDALLAQLRAFVEAVKTRQLSAASGADGLGALRTAVRVVEAMPATHNLP